MSLAPINQKYLADSARSVEENRAIAKLGIRYLAIINSANYNSEDSKQEVLEGRTFQIVNSFSQAGFKDLAKIISDFSKNPAQDQDKFLKAIDNASITPPANTSKFPNFQEEANRMADAAAARMAKRFDPPKKRREVEAAMAGMRKPPETENTPASPPLSSQASSAPPASGAATPEEQRAAAMATLKRLAELQGGKVNIPPARIRPKFQAVAPPPPPVAATPPQQNAEPPKRPLVDSPHVTPDQAAARVRERTGQVRERGVNIPPEALQALEKAMPGQNIQNQLIIGQLMRDPKFRIELDKRAPEIKSSTGVNFQELSKETRDFHLNPEIRKRLEDPEVQKSIVEIYKKNGRDAAIQEIVKIHVEGIKAGIQKIKESAYPNPIPPSDGATQPNRETPIPDPAQLLNDTLNKMGMGVKP